MEKLTPDQIRMIENKVYKENIQKKEKIKNVSNSIMRFLNLIGFIMGFFVVLFFQIIANYFILISGAKVNLFTNSLIICIFGMANFIFFCFPSFEEMIKLTKNE